MSSTSASGEHLQVFSDTPDIAALLPYMTEDEVLQLEDMLSDIFLPPWEPLPGPQTNAITTLADETFYGGAAGGGKTDLLLGTALIDHFDTIIFRREFAQLKGIKKRAAEIYANYGKFNGADYVWRFHEDPYTGKTIELGACQFDGDEQKYQGRPHDLKAFDEITHFTEAQFRFLKGWNRTTRINPATGRPQRCRVIAAGNPPVLSQGQWVIKYWGPWLDPEHQNPAKPGELRWFVTDELGEDKEVPDNSPIWMTIDGVPQWVHPTSRTFIRAKIQDNKYLLESGYLSVLQALPEPLRSRMLGGNFGAQEDDDEWQVIPTAWIIAAQARWAPSYTQYVEKLRQRRLEANQLTDHVYTAADLQHPELAEAQILGKADSLAGAPENEVGRQNADGSIDEGRGKSPSWPKVETLFPPPVNSGAVSGWQIPTVAIGYETPEDAAQPTNTDALHDKLMATAPQSAGVDLSDLLTPTQRKVNGTDAVHFVEGRILDLPGARDVGVDVARGGRDKTVIAERIGSWFAPVKAIPGAETPDGTAVINKLIALGYREARCKIDVIGAGSSPVDVGRLEGMDIVAMNGSETSHATDRSGTIGFSNQRAEWWWLFREALDPELGLNIALPPDMELAADLAAPRWSLTSRGILLEDKKAIKKRIGRSPDRGEALINAFAQPNIIGQGFIAYYREQVRVAKEQGAIQKSRTEQSGAQANAFMMANMVR